MAGGKETPRQKLIGMMYLVLLALLALQVSSVIIEKFQFINASLEVAVKDAETRNEQLLKRIRHSVEEGKNAADDVKIQEKAENVRKTTKETLAYIRQLKQELITKTGGRDENGNYIGAKEEEKVAQYMLGSGSSKNGFGYDLKTKLNDFSSSLNVVLKAIDEKEKIFTPLALDGKDDILFKNNKDHKRKDFAQLNFEGTPLVAALAVLTEKEAKIMAFEGEMLGLLANKVGANIIPIDRVRPVVKARSNRIVAGMDYEAEMFMAAYSSTFQPDMTYNKRKIKVSNDGIGSIKFKAQGGNYQDGMAKKIWRGSITYPKPDGTDSVYTIEQEYYVMKPAVQVISAAVQSLYKNCGNELNIQVPALGVDYNPTFKASGATVISQGKGFVTIIPTTRKVKIQVLNNGTLIDELDFSVKKVPSAEIISNLDQKVGVTPSKLRSVVLKAKVTKDFSEMLPKEAGYRVTKWKAYLVRNRKPVLQQVFTSPRQALAQFAQKARAGDRFMIETLEVKRKNFQGKTEKVEFTNQIINIPIN